MIIVKRGVFNPIDATLELKAIVDFLKISWVFPDSFTDEKLLDFVTLNYNRGLEVASDFRNSYAVVDVINDQLLEPYDDFLDDNFQGLFIFDGFRVLIRNTLFGLTKTANDKHQKIDYDQLRDELLEKTLSLFGQIEIHPNYPDKNKTYAEITDMYIANDNSSDGMCIEDEMYYSDDFKGHSVTPNGTLDFSSRTSASWLLGGFVRQGRSPLEELVNAIFSHGMQVAENNNTVQTIKAVKKIKLPTEFQKEFPSTDLLGDEYLLKCFNSIEKQFMTVPDAIYQDYLNKTGTFHPDYVAPPKASLSERLLKKMKNMSK